MEVETHPRVRHSGKKPPGRVVSPFNLGRLAPLSHDGAHESWLAEQGVNLVSFRFQRLAVCRECLANKSLLIVEIIQVVAAPQGMGLQMKRGSASEMTRGSPVARDQARNIGLNRRERH